VLPDVLVVEIVDGDGQEAQVGSALGALVLRVTDLDGGPRSGVPVSWTVIGGGGSVDPGESSTDVEGLARTTWTLGGMVGTQRVEARVSDERVPVSGRTIGFEAWGAPPPPADWADVVEVAPTADVRDDDFIIGVRLINHWGGTLRLSTSSTCIMGMLLYGPGGALVGSYGGGCHATPTTRTIAPGELLTLAVWVPTASLEPGTYVAHVSWESATMNDGRVLALPDIEVEGVIE
jgi:hypothetical protein